MRRLISALPGTNFYCLRSFVDRKTGETADQLYVSDSYDGHRTQLGRGA